MNSNKVIASQLLVKIGRIFKQLVQFVGSKTRLAATAELSLSLRRSGGELMEKHLADPHARN